MKIFLNLAVTALFFLGSSICFNAHALEPLGPNGLILGLQQGIYEGDGILNMVIHPQYHSTRVLVDDTIEAHTLAQWGLFSFSAAAHLRVVPTNNGEFILLDLDAGGATAGSGSCDDQNCKFTVTVMGGSLTLRETWTATPQGFSIENGSQDFNSIPATYVGSFILQNAPRFVDKNSNDKF